MGNLILVYFDIKRLKAKLEVDFLMVARKLKNRESYRQSSSENKYPSFRVQNDNRLFRIEKVLKPKKIFSEFQGVHAFV